MDAYQRFYEREAMMQDKYNYVNQMGGGAQILEDILQKQNNKLAREGLCSRYAKILLSPAPISSQRIEIDEQSVLIKGISIGISWGEDNYTICYVAVAANPEPTKYWFLHYEESNYLSRENIEKSILRYQKNFDEVCGIFTNSMYLGRLKKIAPVTVLSLDLESRAPISLLLSLVNDKHLQVPKTLIEGVRAKFEISGKLHFVNALYLALQYELKDVLEPEC